MMVLLGHTQERTTKRYSHLGTTAVKRAADEIGTRIAGVMGRSRKAK